MTGDAAMDLSVLPWAQLSPWGIVALLVGLIATGHLQPKVLVNVVVRLLEKHNDQLREENTAWRTALEVSEKARTEQGQQLSTLLESARTTEELVRAWRKATTT